jgi:hypothetical protein
MKERFSAFHVPYPGKVEQEKSGTTGPDPMLDEALDIALYLGATGQAKLSLLKFARSALRLVLVERDCRYRPRAASLSHCACT